jgi:hypothetical protein
MRDFKCYYYSYEEDNFVINDNTACWKGITSGVYDQTVVYEEIYIDRFKDETEEYIELLVNTINQITPTSIEKINDIEYIKYKLLKVYNQDLILLNFIRNLWYKPTWIYTTIEKYNDLFFISLKEQKNKDPLIRLTTANIEACKELGLLNSPGHCNIHNWEQLKAKKVSELLSYQGKSTRVFLTS